MEASGRAQSALLPEVMTKADAGAFTGEHVCIISTTPKAKRHDEDAKDKAVRSYSVGHVMNTDVARKTEQQQQQPQDAERRTSARRKLLGYTSIQQFSHFVELYRGSVSTVYKATEDATGLRVVVKAYHKTRMQPKHHHKLRREVTISARMNGDFVAQMYGTLEDADNVYIIQELCEGGDLFKRMMLHGGKLSESYVCLQIVAPLLRVLEKMHRLQMMHRDIKPENIFLSRSGQLRLGDFGLAVNFAQEIPFSRSGTLDYMAPEVLKNPASHLQEGPTVTMQHLAPKNIKPYTSQVDVWAVGILAYELVCGKPPFEVDDEAKTASLIMYSTQIHFPAGPSAAWADFVRAALVKNPAERADASQLLQHPWIQNHLHRSRSTSTGNAADLEKLLNPLPLLVAPSLFATPENSVSRRVRPASREDQESFVVAPLTPAPSGAITLQSKESMNVNTLRSSSSLLASSASQLSPAPSAHNLAAGELAAAGGAVAHTTAPCVPLQASQTASGRGAAAVGLPPRASPLSKASTLSHLGVRDLSSLLSSLPSQSLSEPGVYSPAGLAPSPTLSKPVPDVVGGSGWCGSISGQTTPRKPSAKPAAITVQSGPLQGAMNVLYGMPCPPSPCATTPLSEALCDSPHPGPGTKERVKWYLQHQKMNVMNARQ